MATMTGHLMGQMFTCCMVGQDQHNNRPRRPRIDRSMIGQPTDFRHTGHIGTTDVLNNAPDSQNQNNSKQPADNIGLLQNQMMSKGGYGDSMCNSVPYVPHIINARSLDEVRRKWQIFSIVFPLTCHSVLYWSLGGSFCLRPLNALKSIYNERFLIYDILNTGTWRFLTQNKKSSLHCTIIEGYILKVS